MPNPRLILIPENVLNGLLAAASHGIALANAEAQTINVQAGTIASQQGTIAADESKIAQDEQIIADLHAKLDAQGTTVSQLQSEVADLQKHNGADLDPETLAEIKALIAADPNTPIGGDGGGYYGDPYSATGEVVS